MSILINTVHRAVTTVPPDNVNDHFSHRKKTMCGAPSTTRLGCGCGFSHLFEGDKIISITNVPPFSLFAVSSIDVQRWIVNGAINGVESVHILSANVNNRIRGKSEKARFRYQQCVCETNL